MTENTCSLSIRFVGDSYIELEFENENKRTQFINTINHPTIWEDKRFKWFHPYLINLNNILYMELG